MNREVLHILIAPNAFKHSLDADAVAMAIERGLIESRLECTCKRFPIGDGGNGTGDLIVKAVGGKNVFTNVLDPLGRRIDSFFGLIDNGRTAVIELANASGIHLLSSGELNPLQASTYGTGEQIKCALDAGVNRIVICVGGSATVDGGAGILHALGARFLDSSGQELSCIPSSLTQLATMDISGLDQRIFSCELNVLCDVENLLLGEEGAAVMFGPQKGASDNDIVILNAVLKNISEAANAITGKDMSLVKRGGAAGGAAAGLYACLNAKLYSGIDYFMQLLNFDEALEVSDLVITGEGSIDGQSLKGKGPIGVAKKAKSRRLTVIGLAGSVPLLPNKELENYFDVLLPIGHQPNEPSKAFVNTEADLIRTSRTLGNIIAFGKFIG